MTASFALALDTTEPQDPTFTINDGDPVSPTQAVTVQIGTSDSSTGGYEIKVWGNVDPSNNPDVQSTEGASAWIPFTTAKAVMLGAGEGWRTLHLRIRDDVLNTTTERDASILAPFIGVSLLGVLPFDKLGALVELDGTPVVGHEAVKIAVWPQKGTRSIGGMVFDHEAECPLAEMPELRGKNRAFVVEGVTYRIVQALKHEFLPHASLLLREVRPNG